MSVLGTEPGRLATSPGVRSRRVPIRRWSGASSLGLAVSMSVVGGLSGQDTFLVTQAELYVNATVIDGRGGPPRPQSAVLVWGGRVRAVGSRGQMSIPQGTSVVDLDGAFIVPGFIDAQASPRTQEDLRELLAAGITGVRDGALSLMDFQQRGDEGFGADPVPRLFAGGPVLDAGDGATGIPLASEEEGGATVAAQAADGAEFVSLSKYVPSEWVVSMAREARRENTPIWIDRAGDGWLLAIRAGADVASRLVSGDPDMLPEGERAAYRELASSGSLTTYAPWLDRIEPGGVEIERAITALLSRDATVVPLLVAGEATLGCTVRGGACTSVTGVERERLWALWPKAEALVRALYDQGVRLLVGSDAPISTAWGEGFHREMRLLANAGIPEIEILAMASRNAAGALGQLHERGTIEAGKRADFLVLEGDPTSTIENAANISFVVLDGRAWRLGRDGDWERARFN